MVKSAIGTVTAMAPAPPKPPPSGWTHKLIMDFYRLPWASYSAVVSAIEITLIPFVNALEWFLGYTYLDYSLDWKGMRLTLYYRQKGTPAIPLATILGLVAVILIAVGFIILGLHWLAGEVEEAVAKATKADLLREGKLTSEQYTELIEAETAQPAPWEKAIGWGVIILILILAYVLLKPREERR